jgi:hypothetical protein
MPEPKPIVIAFPDADTFDVFSGIFKVGCEVLVPTKDAKYYFQILGETNRRIDRNAEAYRTCLRLIANACLDAAHDEG